MKTHSLMMVSLITTAAFGVATYSVTTQAASEVKFVKSDDYADMPFSHHAREDVLKEVQRHFEKLAAKLPAGQDMKIEVLDMDLAGRIEPHLIGSNNDLRILRGGADWPSMKFSYTIASQGKTVKSGKADLSDLNYLRGFNRYNSSEPLRYEKKMLDDWFRKEISDSTP